MRQLRPAVQTCLSTHLLQDQIWHERKVSIWSPAGPRLGAGERRRRTLQAYIAFLATFRGTNVLAM